MKSTTYTLLRKNLSKVLDEVNSDHEPVLITRGSSDPAVLISLEDYNSFRETMHLLSSMANARRLNEAIGDLKSGRGEEKELIE